MKKRDEWQGGTPLAVEREILPKGIKGVLEQKKGQVALPVS